MAENIRLITYAEQTVTLVFCMELASAQAETLSL